MHLRICFYYRLLNIINILCREVLHDEYATKIKFVMGVLFKAIAKSLNLEENSALCRSAVRRATRFNFFT